MPGGEPIASRDVAPRRNAPRNPTSRAHTPGSRLGGQAFGPPTEQTRSRGPDRFEDRETAGRLLARHLADREVDTDLVAAIPHGGLPVGRVIADELGAPFDVIVARKITAPGNPRITVGAATPDGTACVTEDVVLRLGLDEARLDRAREEAIQAAQEMADRYQAIDAGQPLAGKRVLIVDDGVTTGATMRACARSAAAEGAKLVSLAVPVGQPSSIEALFPEADRVFCLRAPSGFVAISQFYRSFPTVTEEEALALLERPEAEA